MTLPIPFRVASILPGLAMRRLHKTTASTLCKPPGGRERPPYNITYTCNEAGSGGPSPAYEPMRASARRRAWQRAAAFVSPPAPGRNVGRAFSPAAWGLPPPQGSGMMPASSPAEAGQCPAEFCRISPPPTGNAPLRLRLTAHPPPLAGEALGSRRPEGSPARGAVGVSRRRDAAPCPANTFPGRRPLPPRRAFSPAAWGLPPPQGSGTMPASSPTEAYGKALPGVAGYLRRKVAMHPSVCAERRIHLPLQGRLCKRLPPKRLPCGSIRQAPAPIPLTAQRAAP